MTERIQKTFFDITSGEREAPGQWLTYVNEYKAAASEGAGSDKQAAPERNGHNAVHAREVGAAAGNSSDSREAIHVTLTE